MVMLIMIPLFLAVVVQRSGATTAREQLLGEAEPPWTPPTGRWHSPANHVEQTFVQFLYAI